jgi:hypothetical protein
VPTPPVPSLIQQAPLDIISSALRLVGSLQSGEVPTASEASDALMIANQMLDAWAAERLSIPNIVRDIDDSNDLPLSLVAGKQAYLLGQATGAEDFYMPRPPRLERVSVIFTASSSTPVEKDLYMADDVEWQRIAAKSVPSLIPEVCYNDQGYPDLTLSFWPIPTQANPIAFYSWSALTQFADLVTKISFPPAYAEAIRFNLAVRLAAEFPGDPQKLPLVMKIASQSKARLESFNAPIKTATVDEALLSRGGTGNIYSGGSNRSHN